MAAKLDCSVLAIPIKKHEWRANTIWNERVDTVHIVQTSKSCGEIMNIYANKFNLDEMDKFIECQQVI